MAYGEERSNSVPNSVHDRNLSLVTLYDAAVRAHDRLPRKYADFGRETFAKDEPDALIVWWCYLLSHRMTIFGVEAPSRTLNVYSDHKQKNYYNFVVEDAQIIARQRNGTGRWNNLCAYSSDLDYALQQLGDIKDF